MQLANIEARLERLTDALLDNVIDQDTFTARREKLLLDKMRIEERLQEEATSVNEPARVQRFLELIKNLADNYISANSDEKREIIQIAISNRTVHGKYVCVEPSDWLRKAEIAIAGLIGAPYRPTSRRLPEVQIRKYEALLAAKHAHDEWRRELRQRQILN